MGQPKTGQRPKPAILARIGDPDYYKQICSQICSNACHGKSLRSRIWARGSPQILIGVEVKFIRTSNLRKLLKS